MNRILTQLSKDSKEKLIRNFIGGYLLTGTEIRFKLKEELGFLPPAFFVISPSMRCNLRCKGCYAGNYTQEDDLTFEQVDDLLRQAKDDFGMNFIVVSGGEPFFWKPLFN